MESKALESQLASADVPPFFRGKASPEEGDKLLAGLLILITLLLLIMTSVYHYVTRRIRFCFLLLQVLVLLI